MLLILLKILWSDYSDSVSHLDEPLLGILIAHSKKKEKIRNQYNQAPNLTQNITLESDKHTLKDYIRESQKDSPFPAGDHKDAMEIKKTW